MASSFQKNDMSEAYLSKFKEGDTLIVGARLADCGEWGGHTESIRVFRLSGGELVANYEKDTLQCPNPGFKTRHIVERLGTELTNAKKEVLARFISQLIGRTYHTEVVNHASDIYTVDRPDKELKVEYWNYERNWSSAFLGLKGELFD